MPVAQNTSGSASWIVSWPFLPPQGTKVQHHSTQTKLAMHASQHQMLLAVHRKVVKQEYIGLVHVMHTCKQQCFSRFCAQVHKTTSVPQKGEEISPDDLNLFIFFTHGQALIVMVHNQSLGGALCIPQGPPKECQLDCPRGLCLHGAGVHVCWG